MTKLGKVCEDHPACPRTRPSPPRWTCSCRPGWSPTCEPKQKSVGLGLSHFLIYQYQYFKYIIVTFLCFQSPGSGRGWPTAARASACRCCYPAPSCAGAEGRARGRGRGGALNRAHHHHADTVLHDFMLRVKTVFNVKIDYILFVIRPPPVRVKIIESWSGGNPR